MSKVCIPQQSCSLWARLLMMVRNELCVVDRVQAQDVQGLVESGLVDLKPVGSTQPELYLMSLRKEDYRPSESARKAYLSVKRSVNQGKSVSKADISRDYGRAILKELFDLCLIYEDGESIRTF